MAAAVRGPACAPPGPRPRPAWRRREPSVRLQGAVSGGAEPLAWSQDNRLAVSAARSVAVLEQLSREATPPGDGPALALQALAQPGLLLHRTALPSPARACPLTVGPKKEVSECREKFANSPDPWVSQAFMLDRTFNPEGKELPPLRGYKYCSWSPLGCDANGRCLLAALTLDNRLTVQANLDRLRWVPLVDLTQLYAERLLESGFRPGRAEEGAPPAGALEDLAEFRRRHSMQLPVRMEWSGLCTTQQVQRNLECRDEGSVLLAVLFESGEVAVWQFRLPFAGKESISSCSTVDSGLASPSSLSWWEYEHGGRRMSGLIVGSALGPVKLLPVNLKAVKGYFTLRQPVVLWPEEDRLPVQSLRSVPLFHPFQKCPCSLVLAARGCYLFWCLLLSSKTGLNVHNAHVTGLHTRPIISMAVDRQDGTVYTCSLDGRAQRLVPIFTEAALKFEHQLLDLSEALGPIRTHGIALSPCGAYLAAVTSEGMVRGLHPVAKSYQVQFVTLKTPEEAAAQLLESPSQSLFRQVDLLDLVRWEVLKEKRIPPFLQEALEKKLEGSSIPSPYFWRFKLFLLRVLHQSLQKAPAEALWRPSHEDTKAPRPASGGEEVAEEEEEEEGAPEPLEQRLREIHAQVEAVEMHLTREHMKQVLGEVYLHTWITENTSVPTRGICDFLSSDEGHQDRTAQVLIGHILKKMNKQTFPEHCSLCKKILPFADPKQAVCPNGHVWLRCFLTYQACQSLEYRRCLLRDSIARHPTPEDPDWIKRLLQGPCTFCDSPVF
ncbi:general transcription factor 3C polypeptide 4 [Anolis sagrei]|uniref:general transcription factor 3C polypeptide 4 n=1 Tax=Anolis sagrei TaxID=38937 RepID=UPI003521A864